jgi:hypothetical protein
MDERSIARPAGADGLMVLLAAGFGQRQGTSVSSDRFAGSVYTGGQAYLRRVTSERSGMPATLARIPDAVRVRKPADGNVPGAPPRGAPV